MRPAFIFPLFFAALHALQAGTVEVTKASSVTLNSGDSLVFQLQAPHDFGDIWGIAVLLGAMPLNGPMASIPGTSCLYSQGFLFEGTLESLDGEIVIPLVDSNALRLGLPAGDLVFADGFRFGGSYSGRVSLLSGTRPISSEQAEKLLSPGKFKLGFRNLGQPVTVGYSGSLITSAVSASLISADGTRSQGAMPLRVLIQQAPEPGTFILLAAGIAFIGFRRHRSSVVFRS